MYGRMFHDFTTFVVTGKTKSARNISSAGYIITYVISVDLSVELLLGTLDLVAFIVLLQH